MSCLIFQYPDNILGQYITEEFDKNTPIIIEDFDFDQPKCPKDSKFRCFDYDKKSIRVKPEPTTTTKTTTTAATTTSAETTVTTVTTKSTTSATTPNQAEFKIIHG